MSRLNDDARWLVKEIAEAKRMASNLGKPQLANSAIESGKIEEYDTDGVLVQIVGEQHDGTHAPVTVNGPIPPEPVPPTITPGFGSIEGRWSGKFAGGEVSPMDFSHVALHASRLEAFTPDSSTHLATITGELGDVATVTIDAGEWTFGLVAVSKAGKWSEMSEPVTLDVPDVSGGTEEIVDALLGLGSAVDGKITVDIKAPTLADGDGKPMDALWNQLDPVTREQVAVWRWNGTSWESMPLSELIIPKINIAEGVYGRLRGVNLEADAVDGKIITGATMQTDAEPAKGLKLDTNGVRVWGPDGGEPVTEIRADGGTVYSVTDPATGDVLAAIDSEGGLTGQSLSIAGASRIDGALVLNADPLTESHLGGDIPGRYGPVINGRSLLGSTFINYVEQHPAVSDVNSWLTPMPHGVPVNAWSDSSAGTNAEGRWIFEGNGGQYDYRMMLVTEYEFVNGRMYSLNFRAPTIRATDGKGGTMGAAHVRRSAVDGSVSAGSGTSITGTTVHLTGSGAYISPTALTYLRCPEDIPAGTVMLGVEIFIYDDRTAETIGTDASRRWEITIADMGLRRSENAGEMVNLRKQGTDPIPTPPAPKPKPVKQYTDTVDASWWQAYTGDGTQATHSTYSGSAAQGRTPYAPGNGVMRGMVGFPSQATRLSGATVKKIEVYVYAKHWHSSAGGTACIGVHEAGSKPSTWSSSDNAVKQQSMKRPEGRWITLPSSVHARFKSGDTRGITFLPPSSSTSSNYYGLFTGNRTKLRITYTK